MAKTILITGATGAVSGGVLAALKGSGHSVRALVRNREKAAGLAQQGVELVVGDLDKPRTLPPAFAGAESVWILTPPGPLAPFQSSNALWAARQGGARHVVRMSAVGAAHDAPTVNSRMHALSDAELVASGIPYTILKPHFFFQNLMMSAQAVAQQGMLYLALGEGRMGIIDARDIGEFAAKVLTTPGHENKTYNLTGPASLSMHDVARAIGEAVGKPVTYVAVPVEAAVESMAKMGMDDFMLTALGDYFTAYSKNWGDFVTDDFSRVMGKASRSAADWARDHAAAFGKK